MVKVLAGFAGCIALPVAAQPRKTALPVIGLLSANRIDDREFDALRVGLEDAGYTQGRNVEFDYQSADSQYDRLPALANQLVQRQVALIIAVGGTAASLAAKKATTSIPILFAIAGDPVKLGLVSGLRRPGGNLTGITFLGSGLGGKRLQILREMVPPARVIGYLVNPANPNLASERKEVETAALGLGQTIHVQTASDQAHIDAAFANFAEQRVHAVIIAADALYTSRRQQLVALATRYRIPTIYAIREFVAAGGLVSYGASRADTYVLVGRYAGKILKGEKVGELPVQQSTKIDLVINLTAAKILDLKLSSNFLTRADEVID